MTDLVSGSVTKAVLLVAASRDRGRENHNAVAVEISRSGGDGLREASIAKVARASDEVHVQISVRALAKRSLHRNLSTVSSPVGVDSPVSASLDKGDVVGGVGGVKHGKLLVQGGLGQVAAAHGLRGGHDVPVDVDLDGTSGTGAVAGKAGARLHELEVLGDLEVDLSGLVGSASSLGEGGCHHGGGDQERLELHDEESAEKMGTEMRGLECRW